ncbi:MAG: MliC family protein [Vogesella sp.]|nr:MliC family protein [Vogesella sp.]
MKKLLITTLSCLPVLALAQSPSFPCRQAGSSAERLVCQSPQLAKLDRQLASAYRSALAKTGQPQRATLKAEQRGWVKGRDDCWKAADLAACVRDSYTLRIAELQARYQLLPAQAVVRYQCGANTANDMQVRFYATEPATLIAERGDRSELMYQQPAASGARYAGRNSWLWEHHGEATVVWEWQGKEEVCRAQP